MTKKQAVSDQQTKEQPECGRVWRYLAIGLSPLALILFLLLENIYLPVVWTDDLTPWFLLILGLEVAFLGLYLWRRQKAGCRPHELANQPKFGE